MQIPKRIYKPLVVAMVDGWGIDVSLRRRGINEHSIPNLNYYWHNYPHLALQSLELLRGAYVAVDDPAVAYESISTGRVVQQPAALITAAVANKTFFDNPNINHIFNACAREGCILNLVGHLSSEKHYSYLEHLFALIKLAQLRGVHSVACHLIIDDSGLLGHERWLPEVRRELEKVQNGYIASIAGISAGQSAILDMISGKSKNKSDNLNDYLSFASVKKTQGGKLPPVTLEKYSNNSINQSGETEYIFFFDIKQQPVKDIAEIISNPSKNRRYFGKRKLSCGTLVNYNLTGQVRVGYNEKPSVTHLLKTLSDYKYRVHLDILSTVEREYLKYFNGYNDHLPEGIEQTTVNSSPDINSLAKAASKLVTNLGNTMQSYDITFASLPLIALAGRNEEQALVESAANYVDREVARVVKYVLKIGGAAIICSAHAGPEMGEAGIRAFSNSPVPFILVADDKHKNLISSAEDYYTQSGFLADMIQSGNSICDIAPTILELMGISKPDTMTANSLLSKLK